MKNRGELRASQRRHVLGVESQYMGQGVGTSLLATAVFSDVSTIVRELDLFETSFPGGGHPFILRHAHQTTSRIPQSQPASVESQAFPFEDTNPT